MMIRKGEYLIKSANFGVTPYIPFHSENIAKWLSTDEHELFLTSSSLNFPVTPQAFECYRTSSTEKPGTHDFLEVYHLSTNQHVGHFELKAINQQHRIGTLAHVVLGERNLRGKGFGREFCCVMAQYGFEYRRLYRLSLSVHTCNRIAVAIYVAAGFVLEGVIRDVLEFGGKRYSLYQMSLLKPEWEALVPMDSAERMK